MHRPESILVESHYREQYHELLYGFYRSIGCSQVRICKPDLVVENDLKRY